MSRERCITCSKLYSFGANLSKFNSKYRAGTYGCEQDGKKRKMVMTSRKQFHELITRFFQLLERHLDERGLAKKPKATIAKELKKFLKSGMGACDECLKFMETFTDSFNEMKEIEQQLNLKVWMLENIMTSTEKQRKKTLYKIDKSLAKNLKQFKEELGKKCSQKILQTLPNLTLTKCENPSNPMTEFPSTTSDEGFILPELRHIPMPSIAGIKSESSFSVPDDDPMDDPVLSMTSFAEPVTSPIFEYAGSEFNPPFSPPPASFNADNTENFLPVPSPEKKSKIVADAKKKRKDLKPATSKSPSSRVSRQLPAYMLDPKIRPPRKLGKPHPKIIVRFHASSIHGESLKRIIKRNIPARDYSCPICDEKFIKHRQLLIHRKKIHNGHTHDCKHCEKQFTGLSNLQRHVCKLLKPTFVKKRVGSGRRKVIVASTPAAAVIKIKQEEKRIEEERTSETESPLKTPIDIDLDDESESSNDETDKGPSSSLIPKKTKKVESQSQERLVLIWYQCPDCTKVFVHVHSLVLHIQSSCKKATNNSITTTTTAGNKEAANSRKIIVKIVSTRGLEGEQHRIPTVEDVLKNFKETGRIEVDLDKPFLICPANTCITPFYTQDDLETHGKLHGSFPCNFCDVVETFALNLATHEQLHANKTPTTKSQSHLYITCARCSTKFYSLTYYVKHFLKDHLSLVYSNTETACAICSCPNFVAIFKMRSQLLAHYESHHNLKKITDPSDNYSVVRCNEENCSAYYLLPRQLFKHLRQCHGKTKVQSREALREMLSQHCQDCGASFKEKNLLRTHRVKHHVPPDQIVYCKVAKCSGKFETEEERLEHERRAHVKEMIDCPKCSRSFAGYARLNNHLKKHDRLEKVEAGLIVKEKKVCELCGKEFINGQRLKKHYLTHYGPESWPSTCKVCGKKFLSNSALKIHNRIHTGEKPFSCDICENKYRVKSHLQFHQRTAHSTERAQEETNTRRKPEKEEQIQITDHDQEYKVEVCTSDNLTHFVLDTLAFKTN